MAWGSSAAVLFDSGSDGFGDQLGCVNPVWAAMIRSLTRARV
ncbi:hypothetical protein W823_13020 [Williamsia sp. D3]|nr:hypothetical protein W823_13020 [Williamsia sp. D3]